MLSKKDSEILLCFALWSFPFRQG